MGFDTLTVVNFFRPIRDWTTAFKKPARGMFLTTFIFVSFQAKEAEARPSWYDRPYNYVVVNQELRLALNEFGHNLNLPVAFSDGVQGRLKGRIKADKAGLFLEQVTASNGLTWYFDGTVLHIGLSSEVSTRIIDIMGLNKQTILSEMKELGIADDRLPVKISPDSRFMTVSGPINYVAAVEQLVNVMEPPTSAKIDNPVVQVFRGGLTTEAVPAPQKADKDTR